MKSDQLYSINDQLVRKYREGDHEALTMLIKRFHATLSGKIYYYTKDHDPVKDIAQECWIDIIKGLDNGSIRIGFDPWALAIARNKAIDWVRNQRRRRKHNKELQIEMHHEKTYENSEETSRHLKVQELRKTIAQLPNSQRLILSLFYLENHSVKEMSKILNISQGTVKSRLYNAREHLKKQINH